MDASRKEPAVTATPAALEAIAGLVAERGAVMFYQSGGCCDGSLPICFEDGEFLLSDQDVLLGEVGGCRFFIDHRLVRGLVGVAGAQRQRRHRMGAGRRQARQVVGLHFTGRARICSSSNRL